jgi:EmrB/QacA subfamily drug resistance transporter
MNRDQWTALEPRQRQVLMSTVAANALIFLDQTAVAVALPAIGREFGTRAHQLQWVITAYLLALAVFMPAAGRLADNLGRKRLMIVGMLVFGLASAACALAPSLAFLVVSRFIQGLGAAVLQPLALGNTTRVMPEDRRGWAIGVFSTGGSTFLILGPLIGAVILTLGDWRWLFVLNLPVLIFALIEVIRWLPPSRDPEPGLDIAGMLLLLAGLLGTVLGLTQIIDWGTAALIPLAVGVALLAVFAYTEARSSRPLIPLALLGNRLFATSLTALFVIQFAVLGTSVYLVLFLQHGIGSSVMTAGLVLALTGMFSPLLSARTGALADRWGVRTLVLPGLVLACAGLAWTGLTAQRLSLTWLVPGLLLFGLSRPAIFTPASVGPFAVVPSEHHAFAASLVTEARQLGAVLGVAAMGLAYAVSGSTQLDADARVLAEGFEAAMLTAGGVVAIATVFVAAWMPNVTAMSKAS